MWNNLLHCSLVTALQKQEKQLTEKCKNIIKMLPKFKGTKYEEALKRVDLHARVRVDLVYQLTWVRLDQTPGTSTSL